MLWTIAVILIILWALGLVSGYTLGNFIHILLVIAIIVVVLQVIQGRRAGLIICQFERARLVLLTLRAKIGGEKLISPPHVVDDCCDA